MQYKITIQKRKKRIIKLIDAPTSIDAEKQLSLKRDEKIIDIERVERYSTEKETGSRPEYKR